MRRFRFILPTVVALLVAVAAVPAAGQNAREPVVVKEVTPRCAALRQSVTVTVAGTDYPSASGRVLVQRSDDSLHTFAQYTADAAGRWRTSFTFTPDSSFYRLNVSDGNTRVVVQFTVPCRSPRVALSPACSTPGTSQSLTVSGTGFAPNITYRAFVYYGWNGSGGQDERLQVPVDANGSFSTSSSSSSTPFTVVPPNSPVRIHAYDLYDKDDVPDDVVDVDWPPCPGSGATTSTSTRTTVQPTVTTTTEPTQDVTPEPAPTFNPLPVSGDGTIEGAAGPGRPTGFAAPPLPPPTTPGATLIVRPAVGPPGFVTSYAGAGFPPGQPVVLSWVPGLGRMVATTTSDGTFAGSALVFNNDTTGPRTLVATGGGTVATAAFLVVPHSVRPSGGGGTRTARTRNFANR